MLPETPGTGTSKTAYLKRSDLVCKDCEQLFVSQVGDVVVTACAWAYYHQQLPNDCPRYLENLVMGQDWPERQPDR